MTNAEYKDISETVKLIAHKEDKSKSYEVDMELLLLKLMGTRQERIEGE